VVRCNSLDGRMKTSVPRVWKAWRSNFGPAKSDNVANDSFNDSSMHMVP